MNRTSLYEKIWSALNFASKRQQTSRDLARAIHGNSDAFVYYRKVGGVTVRLPTAESSIESYIAFCGVLQLTELADNGKIRLSQSGRSALPAKNFPGALRTAVLEYLERASISWDQVEKQIREIRLPELPEPDVIFDRLDKKIDFSSRKLRLTRKRFRQCLTLLSDADSSLVERRQKRLYLLPS